MRFLRRVRFWLLVVVGVLAGLVVALGVAPQGAAPSAEAMPVTGLDAGSLDRRVEEFVRRTVEDPAVPGVAVAVVKDGEVVSTAAAGSAGGDALTTRTPMRIESLSKSFTATAVMQLVEKGAIDLDQPVVRALPELRLDDRRAGAITARQLLTHTSGLSDATSPDLYGGGVTDLREAVVRLRGARLAADPGTAFGYHNGNYQVLARLVEVVSGEPFADYLRRHVFGPAGMTRTVDTALTDAEVRGRATGHLTAFGRAVRAPELSYFADGSGGVVSTAEDLGAWLVTQSSGGTAPSGQRVLRAATVEEMQAVQAPQGSYGFGWYRAESAQGPPVRVSHTGAGGGFSAYQGIFVESGWSVAVLMNNGAGLTSPDPAVLGQNLLHALDPTIPTLEASAPPGLPLDLVLTLLTGLALAWTLRAWRRAPGWAERRRHRRRWVTAVLLLLPAVWVVPVAVVPTLQEVATGRTAPWPLLLRVEPLAVALLWSLALGAVVVIAVRAVRLARAGGSERTSRGPA